MPSPDFDPSATGPSGLAIANHVVRLLSEYTGRGPTKARTSFGDDLVTVVVRDLLTKGERSLVRDGRADLVLDIRRAYLPDPRPSLAVRAAETPPGPADPRFCRHSTRLTDSNPRPSGWNAAVGANARAIRGARRRASAAQASVVWGRRSKGAAAGGERLAAESTTNGAPRRGRGRSPNRSLVDKFAERLPPSRARPLACHRRKGGARERRGRRISLPDRSPREGVQ
jgi:hypothetical protein